MRSIRILLTLALAFVPLAAGAQTQTTGSVDVGVRGTSLTGDGARYERYRDLGDGLFLDGLRLNREANGWYLSFLGDQIGRADQRFIGRAVRPGKVKVWFMWDQIPMLMSRSTRTLFTSASAGVLTVDDAIQTQVQASAANLAALFPANARVFDTDARRHLADAGVEVLANQDLTLRMNVRFTDREGAIPYGGSFGHSSLVELPAPIQHQTTDVDASAEFARGRFLVRGGYAGSFFTNDVTTITFDSPFRITDIASTSARGALSMPPSNTYVAVNGLVSVRLPHRSRVTVYGSTGKLTDAGDPIMNQTVNTANAALILPLPRTTVDGEGRINAATLTFTSRPMSRVDFAVKWRLYEYENRTPYFKATQRVGYDNAPSAAEFKTEPFGLSRHTFDADVRVSPARGMAAGAGFTRQVEDRTYRIFEEITDNTTRLTFDAAGNRWFALRTKYEHTERRSTGDPAERLALLTLANEQPGMRHFDVSSRDRDRVTLIGSVMPASAVAVNLSIAAGKDDFLESEFGVRDNMHRVYSVGMDLVPDGTGSLGWSYAYEKYNTLSRSRQANPGVQFTDPSRNWAADHTDRVHAFMIYGGVAGLGDKVDLSFSYDFNRARSFYNYITGAVADRTLPEEVIVPTTLPTPAALPPVFSELQRGTLDVVYALTARVGVGLAYWHERFRVNDFTLDADANPDLARGSTLLMGYLYRPYTANTVWGRLIVRW